MLNTNPAAVCRMKTGENFEWEEQIWDFHSHLGLRRSARLGLHHYLWKGRNVDLCPRASPSERLIDSIFRKYPLLPPWPIILCHLDHSKDLLIAFLNTVLVLPYFSLNRVVLLKVKSHHGSPVLKTCRDFFVPTVKDEVLMIAQNVLCGALAFLSDLFSSYSPIS